MRTILSCVPILIVLLACAARSEDANSPDRHDRAPVVLDALHKETVKTFINAPGFGVTRLVPLEHSTTPIANTLYTFSLGGQRWRIADVKLIGVVNHANEPVVLVNPKLVDATAIAKVLRFAPKRSGQAQPGTEPLDKFESAAVADFRSGKQLAVDVGIDEIRMVGALRATASCLGCHTQDDTPVPKAGDVFGAFAYRITRVRPASTPDDSLRKIIPVLQQSFALPRQH